MEKTCKICGATKPCTKGQAKVSGFYGLVCWDCYTVQDRTRSLEKNRVCYATVEGRAKAQAASRVSMAKARAIPERRAKMNTATLTWHQENRSTDEGRAKANAAARASQKKYPERRLAVWMKYHTAKLQRLPAWANLDAIAKIYAEAAKQGLTVDHIYPLQGSLVSGLHVANNLQLLTKSENSSKGNRMPALGK